METIFSHLSIRTKIQIGFAILLGILFLVSTQIHKRMVEVRDEISAVVGVHWPLEREANRLNSTLDDMVVALGQYLAVHEQRYIDEYRSKLTEARKARQRLSRSSLVMQNPQLSEVLDSMGRNIDKLGKLGEKLLRLSADNESTYPGLKYANDNLNPITREIQQLLTQMLLAEEGNASDPDKEHVLRIADMRYYWINVVSGVRGYLAYRSDRLLHDADLFLSSTRKAFDELASHRGHLELDQEDTLDRLGKALDTFDQHWKKLQEIHSSERWRADSYLMKTELAPLFERIEEQHDTFGRLHGAAIKAATERLVTHSQNITRLGDSFLLVGLGVGLLLGWAVSRVVARPIVRVGDAMERIASGNADLTEHLDAGGKDEIARLARSFNTFVDKARLSAEEEKAVSRLLRQSLSPSDLDSYLDDALKLLIETVTWLALQPKGGVFLTDPGGTPSLRLTATYNFSPELLELCANVKFGTCLCGRAAASGKIEFANCIDHRHQIRFDGMQPHGHYSVPIMSGTEMSGVLVLYLPHGHVKSDSEMGFLQRVAEVLSLGISLRHANAELLAAKHQAESVSQQLTGIASNIPGIIFQREFGADGSVRYPFIGPGTSRLLGTDQDRPEGDIQRLFQEIHPSDRERFDDAWHAAVSHGEPINIAYRVPQPDGPARWILCNAMPRTRCSGACTFDGLLLDITQRKNLEVQLLQAQKLESVGQLAAGIAHEINTPTQFVQDNTRFLRDAFEDYRTALDALRKLRDGLPGDLVDADQLAAVDDAIEEADIDYLTEEIPRAVDQTLEGLQRIASIVSAMKEFSHPGTDAKTPIDVNAVIRNIATVSRNEWKYVAELETDLDESIPQPLGHRDKLGQVVLNLIVNAAHAIGDVVDTHAGNKGRIVVTTNSDGRAVEIRISDNGAGVPEDIQQRIFDPFFTTKEIGKGTGQGLAIARSVVVDQHGGDLTLQSTPGEGTTFIVRLPLTKEDNAIAA